MTNDDKSAEIDLLSRRQVGEMLSVTAKTICRYERQGHLKPIKLNARVTRYRRADVEKLIADAETGGAL